MQTKKKQKQSADETTPRLALLLRVNTLLNISMNTFTAVFGSCVYVYFLYVYLK